MRAAPETVGTWVNVLAPFTQGLGPRKVRMEWEGEHIAGSGLSRWKIVAAEVVRPPPPKPEDAEVVLAYRAMHEQIQREWREQTREEFQQMAVFTAEQAALFVVGGLAARGLGVVLEATAPMIARVMAKGGTYAVGWFRSVFVRAAPAEKQAFTRLMAKAETQGLEALTSAERAELRALWGRFEALTTAQLSTEAKTELRRLAREDFAKAFPGLLDRLRDLTRGQVDVHHRIPLDFAHLFPFKNVNALENLAAVEQKVHFGINGVWRQYSDRAGASATAAEVEAVAKIVEKHFARWYSNAQHAPVPRDVLQQASRDALVELNTLLIRAGR